VGKKTGFVFVHGPERLPFSLGPGRTVQCEPTKVPFHGIISRGFLQRCGQRGVPIAVWHEYSHRIHDGCASTDAILMQLRKDAAECAVLSFYQSAVAVKRYVDSYCMELADDDADLSCEMWNIKEGHTSSVWQITICGIPGRKKDEFIVNVARDAEAGRELKTTAEKMQAIGALWPELNLAKVLSIDEVCLDDCGAQPKVQVTRNELVPDCYELHPLVDHATGRSRLVLVERFMAPREDRPSQISSVRGRELTDPEYRKVKNDVSNFLVRIGQQFPVDIDFNEGDVVWNGQQGIVIAIR
jgi:hypothetical protein